MERSAPKGSNHHTNQKPNHGGPSVAYSVLCSPLPLPKSAPILTFLVINLWSFCRVLSPTHATFNTPVLLCLCSLLTVYETNHTFCLLSFMFLLFSVMFVTSIHNTACSHHVYIFIVVLSPSCEFASLFVSSIVGGHLVTASFLPLLVMAPDHSCMCLGAQMPALLLGAYHSWSR